MKGFKVGILSLSVILAASIFMGCDKGSKGSGPAPVNPIQYPPNAQVGVGSDGIIEIRNSSKYEKFLGDTGFCNKNFYYVDLIGLLFGDNGGSGCELTAGRIQLSARIQFFGTTVTGAGTPAQITLVPWTQSYTYYGYQLMQAGPAKTLRGNFFINQDGFIQMNILIKPGTSSNPAKYLFTLVDIDPNNLAIPASGVQADFSYGDNINDYMGAATLLP